MKVFIGKLYDRRRDLGMLSVGAYSYKGEADVGASVARGTCASAIPQQGLYIWAGQRRPAAARCCCGSQGLLRRGACADGYYVRGARRING